MKNNNESVALKFCYLTRLSHLFAFMFPNIQIFALWNITQLRELDLFCEFQDTRYYDWTGYDNLNLSNMHLMRFIYVYYLWLSPLKLWIHIRSWRGLLDAILCDKVCQWFSTGRQFSPGTPVSSINQADRDIAELLFKVALNTIS